MRQKLFPLYLITEKNVVRKSFLHKEECIVIASVFFG